MAGGLDNPNDPKSKTDKVADASPLSNEVYQRTDQPWRAGYGQVAPAYGEVQQQQQQQQPQSSQPWRAGYGQVAPGFTGGDNQQPQQQQPQGGQQWRPGYNQVAPGAGGTDQQQQDPNRNGDAPSGPKWQPNVQYNWNSPGPAQTADGRTNQPGQPGRPGQPGAANGDNLYDPHRSDIDKGMQWQIGFPGQMVIGGLSGVAFSGPIPWILNKTADSILVSKDSRTAAREAAGPLLSETGAASKVIPESWRSNINNWADKGAAYRDSVLPNPDGILGKGARWYQRKFDVDHFKRNDLDLQTTKWGELDKKVDTMLEQNTKNIKTLTDSITGEATPTQLGELQRLEQRANWLKSPDWKTNGQNQLDNLRLQTTKDTGLFTAEEMKLLGDRQAAAKASVAKLGELQSGQRFIPENVGGTFLKGAGLVGLSIVADNYLERLINKNDPGDGLNNGSITEPLLASSKSWNTNALLVPMAFSAGGWGPKGLVTKGLLTVGAIAGGKVLDKLLPADTHDSYSQFLRPNGIDSILMAGALMAPVADGKTRALMVGGAWLAGRAANWLEGPSKGEIKDEGFNRMKDDMKDRTASSMNSAIDSFKDLGKKDDYALRLYTSDWLRPNRQYDGMLSAYRGAVILSDAFAESRLDKGTLLPNSHTDFILPGKDLDLGGQATRALLIAQVNLDRAKQQTQNEMGKDEKGKQVSQDELKALDDVGKRVNDTLQNRIYGKHDIQGAVDDLTEFNRGNQKDMLLMKMDIDNQLALNRGSKNTQFLAKLFRDEALIYLASANLKASGPDAMGAQDILYGTAAGRQQTYNNGQPRGYDGALDAIALAKKFDPNNPDNAQLDAVADKLKAKLPQAVQDQKSNPIYNPLNVDDQVNNPGSQNPIGSWNKR
ncbi:MAG TPA: hypothetical protein V6C76_01985 [Drouetiella sp.]